MVQPTEGSEPSIKLEIKPRHETVLLIAASRPLIYMKPHLLLFYFIILYNEGTQLWYLGAGKTQGISAELLHTCSTIPVTRRDTSC